MANYLTYPRRTRVPGFVPGTQPLYPFDANFNNSGLGLWLRADYITTGTLSSGDTIQTWLDSSPNHRDANQPTAGYRPMYLSNAFHNDYPGVWFNGVNSHMSISMGTWGSTVGTLYGVMTFQYDNLWTLFGWSNRTDEYWRFGPGVSYIGCFRNARLEAASISFPATGIHLITLESGASIYDAWDNRTKIYAGSSGWGVPSGAYLGSAIALSTNTWVNGFIHELLVYNKEHTSEERDQVWEYLEDKWDI